MNKLREEAEIVVQAGIRGWGSEIRHGMVMQMEKEVESALIARTKACAEIALNKSTKPWGVKGCPDDWTGGYESAVMDIHDAILRSAGIEG